MTSSDKLVPALYIAGAIGLATSLIFMVTGLPYYMTIALVAYAITGVAMYFDYAE